MKLRLLIVTLLFACAATASTLNFTCLTQNQTVCHTFGSQLSAELTLIGNTVNYTFTNVGTIDSVITQIYWQDNTNPVFQVLLLPPLLTQNGVRFNVGGTPQNLPGGNLATPPFVATFMVSAKNPSPKNGIQDGIYVGDQLTVSFKLTPGSSLQDAEQIRVGMHVQGIAPLGCSDSFLYTPSGGSEVPEPITMLTLGGGLIGISVFTKKFRKA